MFGKYDLRYIDDPKTRSARPNTCMCSPARHLSRRIRRFAGFLSRMKPAIGNLEAAMFDAQETCNEKAATGTSGGDA